MKKILIVEDDQIVANIYRNKFTVEGFVVEVAGDGHAGLELAESFRPDAIILDLMLPKMTGVDFMKDIRSREGFQTIPVIVFSNTYLTNMVQEAWKAGATKCLSKANCNPKQLLEVLRGALGVNGSGNGNAGGNGTTHSARGGASGGGSKGGADVMHPPVMPTEAEFQSTLLANLRANLPATLMGLRAQLQNLFKATTEDARLRQIQDLFRRIHTLTGSAATAGQVAMATVADALEALLKELHDKPKNINASTLRTVAAAIDFLGILFERGASIASEGPPAATIFVVDDEAISRRAVTHALDKAKLKSVSEESPVAAMEILKKNTFDLVVLDVDMPGMNGFELCAKLRTLPAYKKTPVVFVTGLNDFESRANSTMSGGNDFIAKPFLFMELALKALIFIYKAKLA
jgi:CheY-like chemotaxis protein/HPt (histidine-containing phosphotransfer) domain-containing protein